MKKGGIDPERFTSSAVHRRVKVDRISGRHFGLNFVRSCGDCHISPPAGQRISSRPKITFITKEILEPKMGDRALSPEARIFSCQASDGLFDVGTTEQWASFAAEKILEGASSDHVAAEMVRLAFHAGTKDNVVVVLRAFNGLLDE